jgi:glycosyltransferase involved in cell wall biosynthesis
MAPRFSVVLPTRERAHTLRHSLQTCLDQDFEDYEVIVCDNHSSPATRQVVEEAASPRVRYVRAPEPLAMSNNWELALAHATGEYVTVLGDDDGLLSHALRELDRLITRTAARVVRWGAAFYLWPTIVLEGEANHLTVPLGRGLETVDGAAAIAAVIDFRKFYTALPMIYNSVIHRDLIDAARAGAGRVFANHCPDIYSGFVFAYLAGSYLSVEAPMSVSGLSGNSTGVATLLSRRSSDVATEFRHFNTRAGLNRHPWVPELPIFPESPVADSFQFAKEAHFPNDDRLRLDRQRLAAQCVANLWAADPAEWQARLGVIRATLADTPALLQWFDEHHARTPFRVRPTPRLRPPVLGYDGNNLHLRTDTLGVTDVAGAARLCEQVLGFRGREVEYGKDEAREAYRQLEHQLEVSEADRAKRLEMINQLCGQLSASQGEMANLSQEYQRLHGEWTNLQAEHHRLHEQLAACNADRAARLEAINTLGGQLQVCEADRAARLEVIHGLDRQLQASEASRTAAFQAFQAAGLETIRRLAEELAALRANTLDRRLRRLPGRVLRFLRRAVASRRARSESSPTP